MKLTIKIPKGEVVHPTEDSHSIVDVSEQPDDSDELIDLPVVDFEIPRRGACKALAPS